MNDIQKRFLLFLFGCMGLRTFFVYLAKVSPNKYLRIMGFIALIPASGFLYIFLTGMRKTGSEIFGCEIWWNNLRPIHSILYYAFSYFAINENINMAWKFLLLDVIFGFSSFLTFHYISGNFQKLF